MKIVSPSIEIMRSGLEKEHIRPEQHVEKVGRTCYKSEDKITEDSAAAFAGRFIKWGHESVLEHWSYIFRTTPDWYELIVTTWERLLHEGDTSSAEPLRPYLRFTDWITSDGETRCVISGNIRAWRNFIEAYVNRFGFAPHYLHGLIRCNPIFFPEYQSFVPPVIVNDVLIPMSVSELVGDVERGTHHDITVRFICDRGVSHEIVRHRTASFAQESTRYCNYSGDKFGAEITVITPSWYEDPKYTRERAWEQACMRSEADYFLMLDLGSTPQEARAALNNSLKTELVMTTNLYGWENFFHLRCARDAHPDIRVVANMLRDKFDELNLGVVKSED